MKKKYDHSNPKIMINSDDILNIKEVSDFLKIPVSTVYKLAQDGKVPAVKVGKHWRFLKQDLELLFTQKRGEPLNPLMGEGKA